ncbi:MAG: hypothetical protein ACR2NO_00105 [Chloroflexota bacterium]
MTAPQRVYHLALRETHAEAGARFHERLGWSLPAHYGDAEAEYAALRGAAVLLDQSHRSRFIVHGPDALEVLAGAFAGDLRALEEGRALRTAWLDADGLITDVALVARTGGIAYFVSGEPGQREATAARLRGALGPGYEATIDDRTESTCLLALTGPAAAEVARAHLDQALSPRLRQLEAVTFQFHGFRSLAVRTSDSGEDGFEMMLAPAVAQHVVQTLREAGVALAGDIAREAARVETCIPAYSPDLEGGLTPGEAGLHDLLGIPGGRRRRCLVALLLDALTALPAGTRLTGAALEGELRSCVRAFGLDAIAALAVLGGGDPPPPGTTLDAAGNRATIVAKPLYRRRTA